MNAAAMWEKDYYAIKRRCERVEQQLADKEQQLEALRLVVVKWQGSCRSTRQVEETDECIAAWNKRAADAEQQLEQAVRLLEFAREFAAELGCDFNQAGNHQTVCRACTIRSFLSSPAIAPIRERVRQGGGK